MLHTIINSTSLLFYTQNIGVTSLIITSALPSICKKKSARSITEAVNFLAASQTCCHDLCEIRRILRIFFLIVLVQHDICTQ